MRAGQSRRGFIDMPHDGRARAGACLKTSVGFPEIMEQREGRDPVDPDVGEVGHAREEWQSGGP
jgi:hypothetical protein